MSYNNATPTVGWDPANFPKVTGTSSGSITGNSATIINGSLGGCTTTAVSGSYLASSGSGYSNWSTDVSLDTNITDFMELTLMALGYDITFDEFKKMSKEEKKSIIRDIKINRVLKGD